MVEAVTHRMDEAHEDIRSASEERSQNERRLNVPGEEIGDLDTRRGGSSVIPISSGDITSRYGTKILAIGLDSDDENMETLKKVIKNSIELLFKKLQLLEEQISLQKMRQETDKPLGDEEQVLTSRRLDMYERKILIE